MRKALLLGATVVLVLLLGVCAGYAQPMGPGYGYGMGPGMMGPGYGYGMGPGMMGPGYGYGMGPGMMGPGYGYGPGPQYGYGPQGKESAEPLSQDDVKDEVENYLKSTRNPNLKVGKIEDRGTSFEVTIETKGGSLVDRILVDKTTGRMQSAYQADGQ